MSLKQQKAVGNSQIRTWTVDLEAMAACAPWAAGEPELCGREVAGILESFPTFIAVLGHALSDAEAWVEAGEPTFCPDCGDFVVFDRGVRCVACRVPVAPPDNALVGLVGRIPGLISGRPFLLGLEQRLEQMERADHPDHGMLDHFRRSLLKAGERLYLSPRYSLWFSAHWPHSDPPVMVWPEYFPVLGIPPDHVFQAGPYFRLCLYASWREQPAIGVLRDRVAPRLLIDLMVADFQALGVLQEALERLDCTLYELYNLVGRPSKAGPLRQVYQELVGR